MAVFSLKIGAFHGDTSAVANHGEALVDYAARNGSNNSSTAAPANFSSKTNPQTGAPYTFTAGFCMSKPTAGDGKWEGHYPRGSPYRLDLQGYTDDGYANWQLQTNSKNSKTVAAALMRCGAHFSQRHLLHALKESARTSQICIID